MRAAAPTCSVVIPVRDDARALARCLDALGRQSTPALEIVVVDNGSTDDSVAVAEQHGSKVLREAQVGIAAAAARGYDAAEGDLILRLDADSIPPADWIERVAERFAREPGTDALSGPGVFTAVPSAIRGALTGWYWRVYFGGLEHRIGGVPLFGSNLAMRRTSWQTVSAVVHRDDAGMHDDLDLSIHLLRARQRLELDPDLLMPVSVRPLLHPVGMLRRARRAAHTLALHADPPCSTVRWLVDTGRGRAAPAS